ncbi:hypothetical protein LXG23DRAFT_23302 [Yarrowia lipolytica]|uniref:Uncharacterized protein n=1 Tax=Yarrowia lipolytica TaxID=4952 RepID=A0A1D8NAW4_YARLL|nr:hypothetical protein YALI1_C17719g [Yarrowia lipolytica]KAB8282377.1 hypothetical protein BKA91DRAFT_162778 [Yarrowia lipolytica]KAE8171721.1 hypothetical protein BKA90DRAFT_174732 [Yarrowia lipolytica]KAJ8053384.1 hypothetical protein LXG23DRAFT_23302 [Yarrowia lipolytica]RMI95327.1 hypothetical protein BD777DRAFT_118593 [Yarrowia lipolytica]
MFMKHSGNLDTRLLKAVMVAPMPLYRRFEFLTRHLSVRDQSDYLPMINDFKSAHTHAKQTRDYEPLTEMCSGFFRAIAQYVGLVDDSSSTPAAHERQFNMDRKSFLKDPRQQFLVVSYLQSVAYALRNSPIDDFIKCCRLPCLLPDAGVTWYSQRDDNHWGDVLACIEAPESTRSELSITAVCADKQIADMLERYTKVINHLPSSERKLLAARGSWFPRLPAKGDSALMWSVGSHEEVSDASAVQAVKPVSTATHTPSATSRATRAAPRGNVATTRTRFAAVFHVSFTQDRTRSTNAPILKSYSSPVLTAWDFSTMSCACPLMTRSSTFTSLVSSFLSNSALCSCCGRSKTGPRSRASSSHTLATSLPGRIHQAWYTIGTRWLSKQDVSVN